jgi:hypothetical protein
MPKFILSADELKPLWDRGDTTPQIAAKFGVTKSAITHAATRFGFVPRKPGRIPNVKRI